jgi:hypothetical protein
MVCFQTMLKSTHVADHHFHLKNIETRYCEVCSRSISGGDANLLSHQTSKAHKLKAGEAKKDKPTAITNFFGPPKPARPASKPQPNER